MKRLSISLLLAALCAGPAWGAIAHDVSTVVTSSLATDTCSFSHVAGTPTLALFWVAVDANVVITTTPTYGGTTMFLVGNSGSASTTSDQKIYLYELHISSETGTQTATAVFTSDNHHACRVDTFTGTHTTDATPQFTGFDNGGAVCGTPTTTLTLASTASWMVTMSSWTGGDMDPFTETGYTDRSATSTSGTLEGVTGTNTSADDSFTGGDSTGDTGSLTHTTDHGGPSNDECAQVSVELIEPGAPPTVRRRQTVIMGGAK